MSSKTSGTVLVVGMPILASIALSGLVQGVVPLLQPDPVRDRVLHIAIQEFVDKTLSSEQLEPRIREYITQFESKPYKIGGARIEWQTVPQEWLYAFTRLLARIVEPTQRAFVQGDLTVSEAALRLAPVFLIWGGYGMDPPPNADVATRQRISELMEKIAEFAAP
jgi:hypothetical protein